MKDKEPQVEKGVVLSPAEKMRRRLDELDALVAEELASKRALTKKDGVFAVAFYESDGKVYVSTIEEDPIAGVLTAAESVSQHMSGPDAVDVFWEMVSTHTGFSDLYDRMAEPAFEYRIKSAVEYIFQVPMEERVYQGLYDELAFNCGAGISPRLPISRPMQMEDAFDIQGVEPVWEEDSRTKIIFDWGQPNTIAMPRTLYDYEDDQDFARYSEPRDWRKVARVTSVVLGLSFVASLGGGLAAAIKSVNESNDSAPTTTEFTPLPTLAQPTTTESPTTTTERPIDCLHDTSYTVKPGDTLSKIAGLGQLCDYTVSQLILFNPEITNPDVLTPGQVLRLYIPEPTTTAAVDTTTTTTGPEPTTTVGTTPPPPPPETTTPPTPNDGTLSDSDCTALKGVKHSFQIGETFNQFAHKAYGLTSDHDIFLLYKNIKIPFHLSNIYADVSITDPYDLRECVPIDLATAQEYIAKG